MRRLVPLLALLCALVAAAAASAHARSPHVRQVTCARVHPTRLKFTRAPGQTSGVLSWTPAKGAPRGSRYRVTRNGHVVGQTRRHRMRVNVAFGHRYTLRVRLVRATGSPLACGRPSVTVMVTYRLPGAPGFPAATGGGTGSTVRISWQKALAGDSAIAGYRVLRDGKVYGQTHATAMTVQVSGNRSYTFTVLAVDRNGKLSAASAPVHVVTGHAAPTVPAGVTAGPASSTSVQVAWQPSQVSQGHVVGYRVFRGGVPVGQFKTTSAVLTNLTPSVTYSVSVAAVDSLGYVSAASAPVSARTGTPVPPSAPGSFLAAPLSDTVVELSWQPSQAAQGRIVGYRVLRNGTPVGQFTGTTAELTNLAASTTYTFTVLAEDSLGNFSDASATATVRTADPTPTSGHVYSFLLSDTGQSFTDFQSHYSEIGTVAPTYYDCDAKANMTGANVPLITGWAQARQVKVLPRFNCQRTTVIDSILNNPTLRQQWLDNIVGQVQAGGYDGATLDWEAGPAADRDAYTAFVTDLAARLHAMGKTLMVCVSAKTADVPNHPRSTFFDYNALSQQADELFVMAWGIHWTTSAPGAQDDMTWVQQVVTYISSLPRVNKYILGMQLYAMDWPNGGGSANPSTSMEYADVQSLIASTGATPARDASSDAMVFSYTDSAGAHHDVWYTDATTETDRIHLAHTSGFGGVGVWRLGREDQRLWSDPLFTGTW